MNKYKMVNNSFYGNNSNSFYGIADYYEWYIRLKKVRERKEKLKRIWG